MDPALAHTLIERASARLKTFERTAIGHDGCAAIAHILNVSETGAQMHSHRAVGSGDPVRVVVAGSEVQGSVAWTDGRRFGVRFRRKLTTDEIQSLLR